ncbi:HpcH/HpaI aldolase/citrate lyase family protein [Ensifer sp. YR511]|uniref:HpcH/HpaI aldolase family protein n=1 Tax=Ensifer sp. YR511 TaxID=1855294 RepID=UPI00088EAF70|nr:aldolase/citrate lyase family protein [Ensifer sp. YR511]SDN72965.1 4-hydroxy-2-oxoheptanedioate aldolase [Ensifer sp. YR511]
MVTLKNRVKSNYKQNKVNYGVHVKVPAPALVDVAANVGSDFVKFDQYHTPFGVEALYGMIATARAGGMTPWIRCRNDAYEIMTMLDLGIEAISIPNCRSVDDAQAAVAATRYRPAGVRESNRPVSRRGMTDADYFEWAANELLVCVSIEDKDGLENYKDIVKVEGVDVIATGRGDISLALGVPNDRDNQDKVIEAQKRVLFAALEAGKEVSMTYPCTPRGMDEAAWWIEQGVRIITLETEHRILARTYGSAFDQLKAGSRQQTGT